MKRQETTLLGLHYDILKQVMIRVARSSNGAKDFAKAISVCKGLRQFIEDEDVLKAVAFDDLIIGDRWELFQMMRGLVCRCAKAGQVHAQFILGKIILVSTSQWVSAKEMSRDDNEADGVPKEVKQDCYFLENFFHPEACTNRVGRHFDFVKVFLCRARCCDLEAMQPHLTLYMNSFAQSSNLGWRGNEQAFVTNVNFFKRVRSSREEVQVLAFEVLNMVEFELPQIAESPMVRMEFETEVREEIRGARTDVMVLEYNMLLKMLRALKAFTQRRIKALPLRQKLEAAFNEALPLSQEIEPILNRLKEFENVLEEELELLKELQEAEAMLVSSFDRLFCG